MCPICMMRTAVLALAAVSSGGLATFVAARFVIRKPAVQTGTNSDCKQCENTKER